MIPPIMNNLCEENKTMSKITVLVNKEKRESPEELSRLIVACVPGSTGLF